MTIAYQVPFTPIGSDGTLSFVNYGTSDIGANLAVSLDTTNLIGGTNSNSVSGGLNQGVGIIVPANDGDPIVGVTREIIKAGGSGRVAVNGIVNCISINTCTAGTYVMADGSTSSKHGYVKTQTSAKVAVGLALATAADGETFPVLMSVPAKNA